MTSDLQKRLIQFAINTLNILEADGDWDSNTTDEISSDANELKLSTLDDDGYFKSLVTENPNDICVHPFAVHTHPFDQGELITLLEAARVALADADKFDDIAESLDIHDEELKALQEKLNNHMNK